MIQGRANFNWMFLAAAAASLVAARPADGTMVETEIGQPRITICSQTNDKCLMATARKGNGSGFKGLIYFSGSQVQILTRSTGLVEVVRGTSMYLDFENHRVVSEKTDAKGRLLEEVINLKDFSRQRFTDGRSTST